MKPLKKIRGLFASKTHILPIYTQQVAYIKQASSALVKMTCTNEHEEWKRLEKEVKLCETQGDAMLTEFYEQLYEGVFTSLDRLDLQAIAMYIDEFLDNINDSAKSVLLYLPDRIDQQLVELAQYIESEADALKDLVVCLDNVKSNFSNLTLLCDRITELEHAADDAYEEYIGFVFHNEKNPIELMKYKNIAEMFENTTDAAKRVSDYVRKMLLRYSE
ncbi:MAG: DUF47 family protein [Bacteroidetes bacterium]|uniref:DUF47 family protein n=1 Tax=Candidatus Cryptobacteroides faecipullorum TaxID=2840764 RepID=A0A9D9I6R4_9BACT|nr:DUF47 family protein [Candidatus Cryptobacteroides faecipullorum]